MIILPSALKHGINEADIQAALANPLQSWLETDDPVKLFTLGLGTQLDLIELAHTTTDNGETLVFHCMKATKATLNRYRRTLRNNP